MLLPPGVQTVSTTSPVSWPFIKPSATPFIVSATKNFASDRFRPSETAPSSRPSIMRAKKAGVEPQRAVQASICAGEMGCTPPIEERRVLVRARACGGGRCSSETVRSVVLAL